MKKSFMWLTIFMVILTVVVVFSLPGCKTKVTEETTATETSIAAEETTAAETTVAGTEGGGKKLTLKIMAFDNMVKNYKLYSGITDQQFEKENNCNVEIIPTASALTELLPRQNAMVAAKDGDIGVIVMDYSYLPIFADTGLYLPLDNIVSQETKDDLIQWDAYEWKGKHYAVNWVGDTTVIFYRKDAFKEAGLDPEKPPTTFDELYDVAKKITKKDNAGNTTVAGVGFWPNTQDFGQFISAYGGVLIDDNGNPAFNSPEGIEGFKFLKKLYDEGLMLLDEPNTDVHGAFLDGKIDYAFQYVYFNNFAKMKWGDANIGVSELPNNGGAVYISGWAYAINGFASEEIQKLAAKWLEFYSGPTAQRFYATGEMPTGPSFYSMLNDEELMAQHKDWQVIKGQLQTREIIPMPPNEYHDVLLSACISIFSGEKTVEQALTDAEGKISPNPEYSQSGVWKFRDYKSRLK
ncbi:MAG: extracellular solute-binding protein [Candidatus Humimicrobiaceae bacterium]